jgi:hypothetical protein
MNSRIAYYAKQLIEQYDAFEPSDAEANKWAAPLLALLGSAGYVPCGSVAKVDWQETYEQGYLRIRFSDNTGKSLIIDRDGIVQRVTQ